MARLFRGVHGKHPALAIARQGEARPAQPNGSLTPEDHNSGGFSDVSPFTSWTYDREYAFAMARRAGEGGVVLSVMESAPGLGETWEWVASPDREGEDDVLLRGIRIGLEVEPA